MELHSDSFQCILFLHTLSKVANLNKLHHKDSHIHNCHTIRMLARQLKKPIWRMIQLLNTFFHFLSIDTFKVIEIQIFFSEPHRSPLLCSLHIKVLYTHFFPTYIPEPLLCNHPSIDLSKGK
jgi:hypothetical protein